MATTVSPPEDELRAALIDLKAENPTLGIAKIHNLLLVTYPDWTVSEKRTRKFLQNEGLVLASSHSGKKKGQGIYVYPTSCIIPELDVGKWTPKVEVVYFDKKKGKGLVATETIDEGETIWKEDPLVIAPEWEIFDLQRSSTACGFCSTPLGDSSIVIGCPASSTSSFCPARFCNRLCLSRSAKHHPLLCPSQNPASVPLLNWAREARWMALHALAHCTSRILLANQHSEVALENELQVIRSFAVLSLEERFKYNFKLSGKSEPDRVAWKKAHELFVQAFQEPKTPSDKKKLARILKKDLRPEIASELFEYDPGFLRGLGRMSLNLEAHGGLYTLHSHLNHSCSPNVSVRHFDQRHALFRITLIAKRDIPVGEELLVTYVNPDLGLRARQDELAAWGFGACGCPRCLEESGAYEEADEITDLESELKAGLGVM